VGLAASADSLRSLAGSLSQVTWRLARGPMMTGGMAIPRAQPRPAHALSGLAGGKYGPFPAGPQNFGPSERLYWGKATFPGGQGARLS
jgi:hypothetical protein